MNFNPLTSRLCRYCCRWGAPRRGGMTVLGKVAVPKPINLPSQRYLVSCWLIFTSFKWVTWLYSEILCVLSVIWRLENHGLDPTVEIVPKWVFLSLVCCYIFRCFRLFFNDVNIFPELRSVIWLYFFSLCFT